MSAMDAKVVLITGCSSGIGLSLAVRLASDPQKAFKGNRNLCCLVSVWSQWKVTVLSDY